MKRSKYESEAQASTQTAFHRLSLLQNSLHLTFMAPSIITPFIWGEDHIGHSNIMKSDRGEFCHWNAFPQAAVCAVKEPSEHTVCSHWSPGMSQEISRRPTRFSFPKTGWCNSLHLPRYPMECHSKGCCFLRQLQRAVLNSMKATMLLCSQCDQTVG